MIKNVGEEGKKKEGKRKEKKKFQLISESLKRFTKKGRVFLTECWQAAVFLIFLTFEAGHVLKVVLKLW